MALIAWTFVVVAVVAYRRLRAASCGAVTIADFTCGESDKVPEGVRIANRAFMNLVEMPVLFYVLCLTAFVTGNVTGALVALAWLYVGLRVVHSVVYLTYNRVLHRFLAYFASNAVVGIMWGLLALALAA